MTVSWWAGTRLVAARALSEGVAAKGWRAVTALMLLAGIAAVVIPRLLGSSVPTYTLVTVGNAQPELVTQLRTAAHAGDFTVEYLSMADASAVADAVREGLRGASVT